MTDTNDYLDAIDSIEITPKMQQAIDDVIGLIDNRMAGLDNNGERMVTGVQKKMFEAFDDGLLATH